MLVIKRTALSRLFSGRLRTDRDEVVMEMLRGGYDDCTVVSIHHVRRILAEVRALA